MYSFSACMTSKISKLKFEAHTVSRNINVPLRHQGLNFLFSSSGHVAPHVFPIKGF